VIHGDFPEWITAGGLDSVTQYELWKSIWSSLNDGNFFELSWTVERHLTFCSSFAPLTFLGNHDVTRIASKLTDIRHLGHALLVLFTLPGVPAVYYGDEQGFRGVKEDRVGGDDAIRPAFPAGPESLAQDGWPLYRLQQDLIGLRRRHAWLTGARIEVLTLANEQFGYRTFGPGGESLLVLLNIGDEPFGFQIEGSERLAALAGSDGVESAAGFDGVVPAHGWAVVQPA
jgi:glycosidase